MITLRRTNNTNPDFIALVEKLDKYLWTRYGADQGKYAPHNKLEYLDTVVIAYVNDLPAGCGCIKEFDKHTTEIKRMFTEPSFRKKGIASAILKELEAWARELHYSFTILDTGNNQPEAISLYKKSGYLVMENYGPFAAMPEIICMRKTL